MLVLLAMCILLWVDWYWQLMSVNRIGSALGMRLVVAVAPLLCGGILWAVLVSVSAVDVRQDSYYLVFYLAMGAAWVGLAIHLTGFLGVSMRDDFLERRNPAAGYVIVGALAGLTLVFAGGNVGNGPGEDAVSFSAAVSTIGFVVFWAVLERVSKISEQITIDRDIASGLRLAGYLIAEGLIFGRAVAGHWISAGSTIYDFAKFGIPAFLPLALALIFQKICSPANDKVAPPHVLLCGTLPCLVLVGSGAAWIGMAGLGAG